MYMDLRYSHKAELLHSLLVTMVTVLPCQQGYLIICIGTKNICAKYEVKLLSFGLFIAQSYGCHGNSLSIPARLASNAYSPKGGICQT